MTPRDNSGMLPERVSVRDPAIPTFAAGIAPRSRPSGGADGGTERLGGLRLRIGSTRIIEFRIASRGRHEPGNSSLHASRERWTIFFRRSRSSSCVVHAFLARAGNISSQLGRLGHVRVVGLLRGLRVDHDGLLKHVTPSTARRRACCRWTAFFE